MILLSAFQLKIFCNRCDLVTFGGLLGPSVETVALPRVTIRCCCTLLATGNTRNPLRLLDLGVFHCTEDSAKYVGLKDTDVTGIEQNDPPAEGVKCSPGLSSGASPV